MSPDSAVMVFHTDVLRIPLSGNNQSVMVFLRDVLTIPLSCDNAIMANLSHVFLEPYSE